jgi:mono/diheme cytochrome c family protein
MRTGMVVLLCLASMSTAQNYGYKPDPNWRPPDSAVSKPNPLAGRPETAPGGRKLFLRNCVDCHGQEGAGVVKKHAADLQLPAVQQQTDGTLFWKITNGNPDRGMPSFSKLPEVQRWQIVLFLRTLSSHSTTSQ